MLPPQRKVTWLPQTSSTTTARNLNPNSSFARPDVPFQQIPIPGLRPPSPTFRRQETRANLDTLNLATAPSKRITSQTDIGFFLKSEGLARIMDFIMLVNDAIRGKKMSQVAAYTSPNIEKLSQLLGTIRSWIDQIPPLESPQRFGNLAFRTFIAILEEKAETLLLALLPENLHKAVPELKVYLINSFGNGTRMDYGSGHELEFVAFLTCLDLLGLYSDDDRPSLALKCFNEYLLLVRQLQTVYRLEPAGSHGVWGLDDFVFIAYIWGASQLIGHPNMRPKSSLDKEIVKNYAKDYLYLGCIQCIFDMKSGPFHEHSPQLYDISGVPNWEKVNKGLVKMFIAEVLEKVPIVQHLEFGALIPWAQAEQQE